MKKGETMDDENKIVKELQVIKSWLIGIWVAIMCLMFVTVFVSLASAAESHADSVYFNSATDLIAYNNQVFDLRGQPDWEMKVER